jgi:phosphate:Na+ symporter
MQSGLDISKILAGIGIFLLGMNFLEETLRSLSGRSFKLFLRKQTTNPLKAIGGGAVLSGVLQSSSVVNLMVLALVGAGVLTMQNALAVILGTNIGSTLTSWIVATLGFKFNIENFSLPLVGVAGITMALFSMRSRTHQWSKFVFGFASLFVGLGYIKGGFEGIVKLVDFSLFTTYPALFFVLIGFVLTSLIQSSAAAVAIALSALYADAINLYSATAFVLGSEVGTTVKLLLASANGIPAKKRVAFGNFIYNTFVIITVLIVLRPVNNLVTEVLNIKDKLLALVFFQSGINILGVIIFYPFLKMFGGFLENRFKEADAVTRYIQAVPPSEGEMALDALTKEAKWFIDQTLYYLLESFGAENPADVKQPDAYYEKLHSEKYEHIKHLHGDIHAYYMQLNKESLTPDEKERVEQLVSCVRNCMFAAKSMNDSLHDITQFRNSSNDTKYQMYVDTRHQVRSYCNQLMLLLNQPEGKDQFEQIVRQHNELQKGYTENLSKLYKIEVPLNEIEISTLINFNRELYSSFKAIMWAVKDYLLTKEQAVYFSELPGFIR